MQEPSLCREINYIVYIIVRVTCHKIMVYQFKRSYIESYINILMLTKLRN